MLFAYESTDCESKKWTDFSQATYLLNILTLKWYFSDKEIRGEKNTVRGLSLPQQYTLA